ncbi:hypothetical protein [Clostridium beijerinckii]|uniref:hypothetical protein n=1 Tax=Clostridium beijerinckii TaxID=1520 RepID=UPI00156EF8B6|nr:hypothetical protein [Clostridium beijerinckii]
MLPMLGIKVFAADAKADLSKSNEFIEKSLETLKADDFLRGKIFMRNIMKLGLSLKME